MSYSFREPEESAACECKYDEIHDRMDRDDCAFHSALLDDPQESGNSFLEPKRPTTEASDDSTNRSAKTA